MLVYNKYINIGDLVMYLLFSNIMMQPIRRLIQFVQQFESGIAGFQRFTEIMNTKPEINDREHATELAVNEKSSIIFDDVSF